MSAHGKRIDLRFGGFACSVQGFDDPVEPLTRLLRVLQSKLAEPGREADGPLFDEATMRRLEAEIASACDGGAVSAMPGLVLNVTDAEHPAEAAMAESFVALDGADDVSGTDADHGAEAGAEPRADEAVDVARRAALAESDEAEPPATERQFDSANLFAMPEEKLSGEADQGMASPNLFEEVDAAEATEPDSATVAEPSFEGDQVGDDQFFAPETAHAASADEPLEDVEPVGEPAAHEHTGGDSAYAEPDEPINLFDATYDDSAAGTAANLFLEEEASSEAPSGNGASVREDTLSPEDVLSDDEPWAEENVTPLGSFRDLARFQRKPAAPVEENEPELRPAHSISAADLAKKAGASAPAELIGASAAWLAVVKGHHGFTRREVLEVFEQLPGDHPKTAEAKIKGFGKLVRNGQIKSLDDKRFRLSDAERDRYEDLLG